jgi:Protein of unknown function (DUF3570)
MKNSYPKDNSPLSSLLTAALAIPTLGSNSTAVAQTEPTQNSQVKFFYANYEDKDTVGDRMRINEPIAWVKTNLGNNFELEGSYTFDSMSGASPYYYNTLTGASGLGVKDDRNAGDLKVTKYFDRFAIGLGGVVSSEDDYLSRGGSIDTRIWSEDKNTTLALGFGGNSDHITSTILDTFEDSRRTYQFLIGVTQVTNENSIGQVNLTYSTANGYISDPYKTIDNRPRSRDAWAILGRYNYFISSLDASLHTDYRIFHDSWGITSNMLEFAWYQELNSMFTLRPGIRYYSQNEADFFQDPFPPDNLEQFISGDQRVSGFGGVTLSAKLIAEFKYGLSVDAQAGFIEQRAEWALTDGTDSIEPFYARYFTVGLSKSF